MKSEDKIHIKGVELKIPKILQLMIFSFKIIYGPKLYFKFLVFFIFLNEIR
jgi:hypothetical protein